MKSPIEKVPISQNCICCSNYMKPATCIKDMFPKLFQPVNRNKFKIWERSVVNFLVIILMFRKKSIRVMLGKQLFVLFTKNFELKIHEIFLIYPSTNI